MINKYLRTINRLIFQGMGSGKEDIILILTSKMNNALIEEDYERAEKLYIIMNDMEENEL